MSPGGRGLGPARGWGRVFMVGFEPSSTLLKLPCQSMPLTKARLQQPPGHGVKAIADLTCHLQQEDAQMVKTFHRWAC